MKQKMSSKVLPVALSLMFIMPANYALAENSCVSGSVLWKWVEGRQGLIDASAKCGGSLFGEAADDILPAEGQPRVAATTVHVLSSPVLYISQTEKSSSIAEVETAEKLRKACADYVIAQVEKE